MRVLVFAGLVACGSEHVAAPDAAACVEQNVPGTLDACFGTGGMTFTAVRGLYSEIRRVLVLPDDRIVVVGYSDTGDVYQPGNEVLARYLSDGTLDPSFGVVTTPGSFLAVSDAAAAADGTILVATRDGVQRFTADGGLDPDFGQAGRAGISSLTIRPDPDGSMLVVGGNGSIDFTHLTPTGAIDPSFTIVHDTSLPSGAYPSRASFAGDGSIRVAASSTGATAFSVQFTPSLVGTLEQQPVANGEIAPALVGPGVLAGVSIMMTTNTPPQYSDVLFASTANGVFQQPQLFAHDGVLLPDSSFTLVGGSSILHFASDGEHETDLPWQIDLQAIAIDSQGRYVIAGRAQTGLFVMRYWP